MRRAKLALGCAAAQAEVRSKQVENKVFVALHLIHSVWEHGQAKLDFLKGRSPVELGRGDI